jgi:hypothetical protein
MPTIKQKKIAKREIKAANAIVAFAANLNNLARVDERDYNNRIKKAELAKAKLAAAPQRKTAAAAKRNATLAKTAANKDAALAQLAKIRGKPVLKTDHRKSIKVIKDLVAAARVVKKLRALGDKNPNYEHYSKAKLQQILDDKKQQEKNRLQDIEDNKLVDYRVKTKKQPFLQWTKDINGVPETLKSALPNIDTVLKLKTKVTPAEIVHAVIEFMSKGKRDTASSGTYRLKGGIATRLRPATGLPNQILFNSTPVNYPGSPELPQSKDCIPQMILQAMRATDRFKKYTIERITKELGMANAQAGCTLEQLYKWVKSRDDVSIAAYNLIHKRVLVHRASTEPCRLSLQFRINNAHVYPLSDSERGRAKANVESLASTMLKIDDYSNAVFVYLDHQDPNTTIAPEKNDLPETREEESNRLEHEFLILDNEDEYEQMIRENQQKLDDDLKQIKDQLYGGITIPYEELTESKGDDLSTFTMIDANNNISKFDYKTAHKVILIEIDNLRDLFIHIFNETNMIPINITCKATAILQFQHPITGQIFKSTKDYLKRKALCAKLFTQTNFLGFKWSNQSYSQITENFMKFELKQELPKSLYSPELQKAYQMFPVAPYIGKCDITAAQKDYMVKKVDSKNASYTPRSIDQKRQYLHLMLTNQDNYPVFTPFNDLEPITLNATTTIVPGEYIVNKEIRLAGSNIKLPAGLYPAKMIKYCLEVKAIDYSDITHVVKAKATIPFDYFNAVLTKMFANYDESKDCINQWLGTLGRFYNRTTTSGVSMDFQSIRNLCDANTGMKNFRAGKLYFVHQQKETALSDGHHPIWRQIVCSSIMELDKTYHKVMTANTIPLGFKVDAFQFFGPMKESMVAKPKHECLPGDHHIETYSLRGKFTSEINYPPIDYNLLNKQRQFNRLNVPVIDFVPQIDPKDAIKGCFVDGSAGSNKTSVGCQISKLAGDKVLVLAPTNIAVNNFKHRAATYFDLKKLTVKTIDSAIGKRGIANFKAELATKTHIIVDEAPMMAHYVLSILLEVKQANPTIAFWLIGDFNQIPSIGMDFYRYEESSLIHALCDGNRLTMAYDPKCARFDSKLHDKLTTFQASGILKSDDWQPLHKNCKLHIVFTNDDRKTMCRKMYNELSTGKNVINGLWVGIDLIAYNYKNDIVCKNTHCIVTALDEKSFTVTDDFGQSSEVLMQHRDCFRYGWALTPDSCQATTFTEPFNVYNPGSRQVNINHLYAALSRAKRWDQIGVANMTGRQFKPLVSMHLSPAKPVELKKVLFKRGRLYSLTSINTPNDRYIGKTTQSLEARLAGHKDKPTSLKMEQWLKAQGNNVQINELDSFLFVVKDKFGKESTIDLDNEETRVIKRLQPTLNTSCIAVVAQEKVKVEKKKPSPVDTIKLRGVCELNDDSIKNMQNLSLFRIRYYNKTRKCKDFSYINDSEATALAKAKAFVIEYNSKDASERLTKL